MSLSSIFEMQRSFSSDAVVSSGLLTFESTVTGRRFHDGERSYRFECWIPDEIHLLFFS